MLEKINYMLDKKQNHIKNNSNHKLWDIFLKYGEVIFFNVLLIS